ncbi:MAG TPA: DinB family protein [Friedmanniella sp.]
MTTRPERWTQATVHPDLWVDPDDDPRESETSPVGERATLLDYLRAYRHTLRMKCAGLSGEQLALRSVPPSTMSLLGLVRHLGEVELSWTQRVMQGGHLVKPYSTAEDRDGDFNGAVGDPAVVEHAWATWEQACSATDVLVDATADLGTLSLHPDVPPVALREVLVHLIEEYARHCGHADLLRECIDGRVGQ